MTDDLLQIGDFAKQADTNLRTLRYYEELGLLQPVHRSSGKFRYYSKEQLKRIASIKRLQGLGLSLQEIQEIMVPNASELTTSVERVRAGLDKQITLVEERVNSLAAELEELRAARKKLEDCSSCEEALGSDACDSCAITSPVAVAVLRALI